MPNPDTHDERQKQLTARVHKAWKASRTEQADTGGVTCDLCNDAAWWPANGFSEAERQQFCGPRDLKCPGFGGEAE